MSEKLSIESDAISFASAEGGTFALTMRSAMGRYITVTNEGQSKDPVVDGDPELAQWPAIVNALWLAAVAQQEVNELVLQQKTHPTKTATKEYKRKLKKRVKQAKSAAKMATALADLVDSLDGTEVEGWCSQCLSKSWHQKVSGKPLYVCASCGAATMKCSAIRCKHFAAADLRPVPVSVFCAEHTHRVPDFERIDHRIEDLTQWRKFREFKAMHVARAATFSGTAVAMLAIGASGGLAIAPMIGSAIGTTFLGLSGAAATNAGLAALGFGSLASGGLGMAGGSMVVAAAGGLLGSAFGVQTLNAYLGEDKSFDIRRVRNGTGTPVLIARGFTTEKNLDWSKEVKAVEAAYPTSPVYLIEWGSKERRELLAFLYPGVGVAGGAVLKGTVKRASKKIATHANAVGLVIGAVDLLAN